MNLKDYGSFRLPMIDFIFSYSYRVNETHDQRLLFLWSLPRRLSNVIFTFPKQLAFSLIGVNQKQDRLDLGILDRLIYRLEY